jgi:AcrR family transcriptional regulator
MTETPAFRRVEPDARRQSLVEACARVLARDGAGGATVRSIATEAGVSPSLVGHYFSAMESLIEATHRYVGRRVDAALQVAIVKAGPQPREQLEAFVTASFAPDMADRKLLADWVAFWSLVVVRPGIARQHDRQYKAFRTQLERLLTACGILEPHRRLTAIAIAALVEGLWLELCLSPDSFTPEEARQIACEQLESLISTARGIS